MAEPFFPKPGEVYVVGEPEFFGALPVGVDVRVHEDIICIGPRTGPSSGEIEFAEHGSIALRFFCSSNSQIEDNTIDGSWTLAVGGSVLVRGKQGGFYMTELAKDKAGWYVECGDHKPRVTFDERRNRWVITELV